MHQLDPLDLAILETVKRSPDTQAITAYWLISEPLVKQLLQQLGVYDRENIVAGRLRRLEARELLAMAEPDDEHRKLLT